MFFLRGFDEKYSIPSFGVYVLERFSGLGFVERLNNAIDTVKSMGIRCLMSRYTKKTNEHINYIPILALLYMTCVQILDRYFTSEDSIMDVFVSNGGFNGTCVRDSVTSLINGV